MMTPQGNSEKNLLKRIGGKLRSFGQAIDPGPRAWRGVVWGALVALAAILLTADHGLFGPAPAGWLLVGTLLFLAVFGPAGGLLTLLWRVLKALPASYV